MNKYRSNLRRFLNPLWSTILLFSLNWFGLEANGSTKTSVPCLKLVREFKESQKVLNVETAPLIENSSGIQLSPVMRKVGVQTFHKSSNLILTAFLPLPASSKGKVLNLNALDFKDGMPKKFVYTDGTLQTPFILINDEPGTLLSACITELTEQARNESKALPRKKSNSEKEYLLEVLRTLIGKYLAPAPLNWEVGQQLGYRESLTDSDRADLNRSFEAAKYLEPGHSPLVTQVLHPAYPLEMFLWEGQGPCVPKVLFTALILQRLKIPFRLRAGGVDANKVGHLWIELEDGRNLDPTWEVLDRPNEQGALPGWFHFSLSFLFKNHTFPLTIDNNN